ncbi:IS4 family transposase, partial [Streptomyces triculaminicus]|uniref:IS4 family transposase n=1 Tax=Streptomyces triculaminicus TaxID=2816232 RepID=UPI0033CA2649
AVDSTCWDVADTPANQEAFSRPGNTRGPDRAAFPQVRMAALAECGTRAVLDAELGGCRTGELTLAARLVRSTGPGMLVLADREFLGVPLWRAFTATGAHLLWRVSGNRVLPVQARLRDGSWLSRIHAGTDGKKRDPVRVRVIAYGLEGHDTEYRLVTDLLDADRFPARELAALYCQRWEIESVFAEIKTQQRGTHVVLSSKTPDGVLQQIWAHLLVHHALRALACRTAASRGIDPDRLSFTDTLWSARRSVTTTPGVFSP